MTRSASDERTLVATGVVLSVNKSGTRHMIVTTSTGKIEIDLPSAVWEKFRATALWFAAQPPPKKDDK
jgi:hypothetical protein